MQTALVCWSPICHSLSSRRSTGNNRSISSSRTDFTLQFRFASVARIGIKSGLAFFNVHDFGKLKERRKNRKWRRRGRGKKERRRNWRDWLPDFTDQWSSFGAGGSTRSQDWNTQLSGMDSKGNLR